MNASDIIAEATRSGLRLKVLDGNLVVSGDDRCPPQLIEAIRNTKTEVLELLQLAEKHACEESEESKQTERMSNQDDVLPPSSLPMPDTMSEIAPGEQGRLIQLVLDQGHPATGWRLKRASEYFAKFPGSDYYSQDAAAALDLLKWQGRR